MPQLRVYRSFIKKAADSGKYLIIWDDRRRYEGQFKGFDPQGEFVILANVKIKDENEEIESPEILIPIENIKIVSTETEEEYARRRAEKSKIRTGYIMPGVTEESVRAIESSPESLYKVREEDEKDASEPEVSVKEQKTAPQPAPPREESSADRKTEAALEPAGKDIQTEKAPDTDLVSVLEEDVDTNVLSTSTRELVEKLKLKEAETKETANLAGAEQEKARLEETAPAIEEIPKIEVAERERKEGLLIPEPKVEVKENVRVDRPQPQKVMSEQQKQAKPAQPQQKPADTAKPATAVIEEKSRKAASSTLFKEQKVGKPEIPKRRVDVGTLILDIIIVILSIVAIGILAITLFNIRLPFF